jgi:hypothetical protein
MAALRAASSRPRTSLATKIAIWNADIRLQRIPLNETAIASPTLTADSMIQPTNIDRDPRRNMALSANDLNDLQLDRFDREAMSE